MENASDNHTLYLMGGLGNNLFQLNFATNLRDAGNTVLIDTTLLSKNSLRARIRGWSAHDSKQDLKSLGLLGDIQQVERAIIFSGLGIASKFFRAQIAGVKYYGRHAPAVDTCTARHLFGYFHLNNTPNRNFLELLRSRATEYVAARPDLQATLNHAKDKSLPVVHVRGGDFAKNSQLMMQSDYYSKALEACESVLLVTDDVATAEKVLIGKKKILPSTQSSIDHFIILALAEKKVLANSTFSWWAAEIGGSCQMIIEPRTFYVNQNWNPITLIPNRIRL
jgi:hypothetical protein